MSVLCKDAEAVGVRWSEAERLRALQKLVPRKTVDAVLRKTGHHGRLCPRLPRWFVVWFVIALGLFCQDNYRQVFKWLQRFRKRGTPGRSTLCEARHSLGASPLRLLAEAVITLLGKPKTPHAFYAGMRLMAWDGFVVDLPDTEANERAFGRPGGRTPGAFPQARILSLCELGTHVLWRSLIKPCHRGESPMAHYLARFLQKGMLLLQDRNFLSYRLVTSILERGAHLLARAKSTAVFPVHKRLPDGSFLSKLYRSSSDRDYDRNGIVVRVIEYTFRDPHRPGSGEKHRLVTTLLSAREHPAKQLIVLYHERWEEELTIDELKTHQRQRPVLRSQTPAGVVQELYGLLLGHFVIRQLMCEAAVVARVAPRDLSFVDTLKILRCRLPEVPRTTANLPRWYQALVAEVAEAVLPPRRDRINSRVVKRKMSHWPKKREKHYDLPQPSTQFRQSIVMMR
jgi:Insertion element 4 transposase N-terminal/Transposase DDE domain